MNFIQMFRLLEFIFSSGIFLFVCIFTSALSILVQMFRDFLRLILPEDQLANCFYDWNSGSNSDWNMYLQNSTVVCKIPNGKIENLGSL